MTDNIRPHSGPQEAFLASCADIAIYGGAAGAGKTWAELLEPLRHVVTNSEFAAVFFRRTTVQIKNPGGLWDASMRLYPLTGAVPTSHVLEWKWPHGGKIKMAHLEYNSTVYDWQGAEIPLILFDELTHFTKSQFFYMLSRNRSLCGVKPYIRATCNPDADSWVAQFIEWWIDKETGYPILERSGILRWFIVLDDTTLWGDSKEDLIKRYGDVNLPIDHIEQVQPKSVTFIPGKLTDNPALMKADPGYLANLKAQNAVEQARLLGGNWKIRSAAGLYFKRSWIEIVNAAPSDLEIVRYWDLAATEKTASNDPDWTVGVKLGRCRRTGLMFVLDVQRDQVSPLKVEMMLENVARSDGTAVRVGIPQDPGQAGKSQAGAFVRRLQGFDIRATREAGRGDKIVRFGPFSAQCQAGNVKVVRARWNEDFFVALEGFPDATHDDDVDACAGAYYMLTEANTGLLEFYKEVAEESEKIVQPVISGPSAFMQAFK